MRLKTAVIGPTTYKTFRKELLVLILGQPPRGDKHGQSILYGSVANFAQGAMKGQLLLSRWG